jgi:hypothetical protein
VLKRFDIVLAAAMAVSLVAFLLLLQMRKQARQARLVELAESRKALRAQEVAAFHDMRALEAARRRLPAARNLLVRDLLNTFHQHEPRADWRAFGLALQRGELTAADVERECAYSSPELRLKLLYVYARHGAEPPPSLVLECALNYTDRRKLLDEYARHGAEPPPALVAAEAGDD